MNDTDHTSPEGLSEGEPPLTPERAMGMMRTTHFVMSAVAATPDCPVLFVDVGEGFVSLAHLGDIERLIEEIRAPAQTEIKHLRAALADMQDRLARAMLILGKRKMREQEHVVCAGVHLKRIRGDDGEVEAVRIAIMIYGGGQRELYIDPDDLTELAKFWLRMNRPLSADGGQE